MKFNTEEQTIFENIRKILKKSKKPLFFYHDDADGVCSFLQMYNYVGYGKNVIVKSKPFVDSKFFKIVDSIQPDYIFTLDLAVVTNDFIEFCDKRNIPLITIDHHELPKETKQHIYYNPKLFRKNDITSCSELCFYILEQPKEMMWISSIGSAGDWQIPSFVDELFKLHPELEQSYSLSQILNKEDKFILDIEQESRDKYTKKNPEFYLFNTKIGLLSFIISFAIKGKMNQVKKSISSLTKIKHYNEILQQNSPPGKFVWKNFIKHLEYFYPNYYDCIKKTSKQDKLLKVYSYNSSSSFSSELSNFLYYHNPDAFVVVARLKDDFYRTSLRYKGDALALMKKITHDIEIQGGGHKNACGLSIPNDFFRKFKTRLKKELVLLNS